LKLIGGLQRGTVAPGDYRFYIDLFDRLPREVGEDGKLTRFVAFDNLADGDGRTTFLGIEVDRIDYVPEGMIAWDLGPDCLTVLETVGGETRIVSQDGLDWSWRDVCCRTTGEFSTPGDQHFAMTANSYVVPGRQPPDEQVYLVDHDPSWPAASDEISRWLFDRLGPDVALRIEHFGSTAIPGMPAKPVIDILVQIPSLAAAKQAAIPRLNLPEWEYWWYSDHMVFIGRDTLMGRRTCHIHMMPAGEEFDRRLAFRDYLRSHPKDAARYAELKRKLAQTHRDNRENYTDAKAAFVQDIVAKANRGSNP